MKLMSFGRSMSVCGVLVGSALLAACGSGVPACSDTETTDLVVEIADREFTNQMGAELAKVLEWEVVAIRTTDENEKTGALECAANLQVTGPAGTKEAPITYTVEKTDDGDFYVNVFGL